MSYMSQFHQHPDGLIYVRAAISVYCDTSECFSFDNNSPVPALPPGIKQRIYDRQAKTHRLFDAFNNHVADGDVPWHYGDAAIANIASLLTAQLRRTVAVQCSRNMIRKVTP